MKKIRTWITNLVPGYAILPLLFCVVWNVVCFYLTKLFLTDTRMYNLSTEIDCWIPFSPFWILIYILSYVQWMTNYILICRESRELCFSFLGSEMLGKTVSAVFFLALPTTIVRPEVVGGGIWNFLVRFIYAADTPVNLFPSLHCYCSWISSRKLFSCKRVSPWYKWASVVFSFLVFASTVLVKQHFFVDILAGVALAELVLFFGKILPLGKGLAVIDRKLFKFRLSKKN